MIVVFRDIQLYNFLIARDWGRGPAFVGEVPFLLEEVTDYSTLLLVLAVAALLGKSCAVGHLFPSFLSECDFFLFFEKMWLLRIHP